MSTPTRIADVRLTILPATPGIEHLEIHGSKLPSYEQVLLCYMAMLEKLRNEDGAKHAKVYHPAANNVANQVKPHYQKSRIITIHDQKVKKIQC